MDDEKAAVLMSKLSEMDTEDSHFMADELLLELLKDTHPLTVEEFRKLNKWYA